MQEAINFTADCDLDEVLSRPLLGVFLEEDEHGYCQAVTLWHGASGVTITSNMYDAAFKLEVGVLDFKQRLTLTEFGRKVMFTQPLSVSRMQKLTIEEAGITFESGIKIFCSEGTSLRVVPADFPCFLTISGVICSSNRVPEYQEETYRLADLTSIAG